MTRERAKELLPIIQAYSEGKEIEASNKNGCVSAWEHTNSPSWREDFDYRIKQEPKLRPWKPEEVPVGACLKSKTTGERTLILANWWNKIQISAAKSLNDLSTEEVLGHWEYSTDNGKTWHPCGIME